MNKLLILSVLLLVGCGAKYERGQCYEGRSADYIVQINSVVMGEFVTIYYEGIDVNDNNKYFDFSSESSNFQFKYKLVEKEQCKGVDMAKVESRLSSQIEILSKRLEETNEDITIILKKIKRR